MQIQVDGVHYKNDLYEAESRIFLKFRDGFLTFGDTETDSLFIYTGFCLDLNYLTTVNNCIIMIGSEFPQSS